MRSCVLVLSCASLLFGCSATGRGGGGGDGGGMGKPCAAACKRCNDGRCYDCTAGEDTCNGSVVVICNPDGTLGQTIKVCDSLNAEICTNGQCLSACEAAAASHSYIGCDYWPVTTLNSQLNPHFDFAVAVANPLSVGDVVISASASVTVTRGNRTVGAEVIRPGEVKTIILPWVKELSQNPECTALGCLPVTEKSVLLRDGAYHLESDIPVIVYQFNPLQFEKTANGTCRDQLPIDPNKCHSYTNDASLLLPSTVMLGEYLVISRPTFAVGRALGSTTPLPGFFAVVGTQDGTEVTVTSTANTEAGTGVEAQTPGSKKTYQIDKGTVLQIISKRATRPCADQSSDANYSYCNLGDTYDLTGSRVSANKPVGVIGGHSCSFVPYNKFACDHLEEQLFPLETWGQKILVAPTEPQARTEPNIFRIVSGSNNNTITFDPSLQKSSVLNEGEFVEFSTNRAFQVSATGRIAVAQFMVGANYTASPAEVGDPALGLGIPFEQYRLTYDFLTPSSYTKSYVNVIAPMGASLKLDDQAVPSEFTAIGSSGFGFRRIEVQPGSHSMSAGTPFGITVSGIGNYTSYLYPGGLNLNEIVIP